MIAWVAATFRYEDHVADLWLVGEGSSPAEALAGAADGLLALLWDGPPPPGASWRAVAVRADGAAEAAADLLTELLFLVDAPEGWPAALRDVQVTDDGASAAIGFVPRSPAARPQGREVKAVSRRELSLAPGPGGGWRFRALLDL